MKKLAVGIPTYNRYDLLEPCLGKYSVDFPDSQIYIVDNGRQNISTLGINVIENSENIGVGASWNQLCQEIFRNYEYALILNDDIYLGKNQDQVLGLLDKKKAKFIRATPDWCAFVIHKSVYDSVGPFDECFLPAYFEDKSYEYRMKMLGVNILKHPDLNPIIYRSSMTIEKDKSILEDSKKNKKLYLEMWGGEPGKEKFKKPFNAK